MIFISYFCTMSNKKRNSKAKKGQKYTMFLRRYIYKQLRGQRIYLIGDRKLNVCKNSELFEIYENTFNISAKEGYDIRYQTPTLELDKTLIYFIGSLLHGYCKIGRSDNPKKRITFLQTECPFQIGILYTIEAPAKLETELHKKYKIYHSYGEWFKIKGKLKEFLEEVI